MLGDAPEDVCKSWETTRIEASFDDENYDGGPQRNHSGRGIIAWLISKRRRFVLIVKVSKGHIELICDEVGRKDKEWERKGRIGKG